MFMLAELPEFVTNPYVIAFVVAALALVAYKAYDQKTDDKQGEYQEIADAFALIGLDIPADYFKARARDANEKAYSIVMALVERLKKPGGPAEVVATMIMKVMKDPDFTNSVQFKTMVQPVLAERVLGSLFTPELKAELMTLAPVLREYGSQQFADVMTHLLLGNIEAARAAGHQLVSLLRNVDQLDDELVKRAAKAIPRAVQADQRHWATLNDIITKAKPAAPAAA